MIYETIIKVFRDTAIQIFWGLTVCIEFDGIFLQIYVS